MRKLRIIYEDKWLVVIEKPSGLLSVGHPTANEENAWHLVGEYLKSKNYRDNAYVCHRLDKFTSGILMFSKSEEIQHQLRDNWNDYVLDRRYVAVTEVVPNPKKAEIRSYLTENSAMFVHSTQNTEIGKLANDNCRIALWLRAIDALNREADFSRFESDPMFKVLQNEVKMSNFSPRTMSNSWMKDYDDAVLRYEGAQDKARDIASDMLLDNEPVDKIVKYTKLPESEVLEIKASLDLKK